MSKIAKPGGGGQQDQKKIYLDWANHYLRKSGQSDVVLADLKDISDGYYLPRIIQAVVSNKVPGVQDSTEDKAKNIDSCVKYMKEVGVNCSTFKANDIAEGNMKSILSMFYNLSQLKKPAKTSSTSSEAPPTSRIARPVSPGLKVSHGTTNAATPLSKTSSLPAGVTNGNTSSPAIGRRTAGSSILTTTTYDRPYSQRRVPYKQVILGEAGEKPVILENEEATSPSVETKPVTNGYHSSSGEFEVKTESKCDTCTKELKSQIEHSKSKLSRLSKPKESKLVAPGSTNQIKEQPQEGKQQVRSKTLPHPSKLQAVGVVKRPEQGGVAHQGGSAEDIVPRPQSRLKFPASGRSTPSGGRSTPSGRGSGLVRPSGSRLEKMGSEEPVREESKLRLTRNGSDGATKRHKISPSITNVPGVGVIEAGTHSSHTPTKTRLPTPEMNRKQRTELDLSSSSEHTTTEGRSLPGLKKPSGGLRKPSGGFGFGGKQTTPTSNDATPPNDGTAPSEGASAKRTATVEKKPSFSKLSRFGVQNKLTPPTHSSHPSHITHITQAAGGSTSSLDSTDIKLAVSSKLDSETSKGNSEPEKPAQLEIPESTQSSTQSSTSDLVSPPPGTEFKLITNNETKDSHPRYGRRISPEGMSHEEATSPHDITTSTKETSEDLNRKNKEKSDSELIEKTVQDDTKVSNSKASKKLSLPETGQSESLESPLLAQKQGQRSIPPVKHSVPPTKNEDRGFTQSEVRTGRQEEMTSITSKQQRARSLSPKSSHRIIQSSRIAVNFDGSNSSVFDANRSGSSEDIQRVNERSPLKSSLRGGVTRGVVNKRTSSSSSGDSASSSPSRPKVVISPRSSQLVYDPSETRLNGSHGNHITKMSPDRPMSFADTLSSASSGSYHSQQLAPLTRHTSVRSTLSERLDYQEEEEFLQRGLPPKNDKPNSNPEIELIGTFETQLSSMKEDLASKQQMLSMYETSMADLSSKVHHLKKTLDEKDREIRQLTDEKDSVVMQPHWFDLDGRSLASRAASVNEVLSDGCLSDSAMDSGVKGGKKKKKSWKFFKKSKGSKDKDHLSPSMDTESIMSGRSSSSRLGLRRTLSAKRKTPDLMSISEYVGPRYRDPDTKSTYTMDARSEYAMPLPMIWADEAITVYIDESPGAKVKVYLQPELDEPIPVVNDSGFYGGDGLSRHSSNSSGLHRDSCSSDIVTEGGLILGTLSVAPETSWVTMDTKIGNIFMHQLNATDQEGYLGITEDSIYCYLMGDQRRAIGNALLPLMTPYQAISESSEVRILMRGSTQESCDSLAYKTLMNTESLQSYMNMLQDTHWLVVMGTKGTCKTSLATGLARHLSLCVGCDGVEETEGVGGEIVSFNLDKDGMENALKYIKNDLVKRTQLPLPPPILLLEDIYECAQLEQIFVAATPLARRPYIIATLCSSGTSKGIPLHQLLFHHQIRVVTCNPSTEPVVGILARTLRKQVYQLKATTSEVESVAERLVNWLPYLHDHLNQFINKFHSNNVNLGPRVFMGCPLHQSANELEAWFLNLWNYFIIPYLMGTIMAGIETYTADPHMIWTDVREWVIEMYPWQPSMNISKLRTLNPEDVGWNHAVRPQQNRLMILKDEDTRSLLHA